MLRQLAQLKKGCLFMPKKPSGVGVLDELRKKGVLRLGNDPSFAIRRIAFGIPELDDIIGGGVPRDRFTILSGTYSSGKSFLAQLLVKHALEDGLSAAYVDTERSFDAAWWTAVGVDPEKIEVAQTSNGERAIDVTCALAAAGVDVVVVDSLAGLVPTKIAEEDAEKSFIALQARLINRLFQKLLSVEHSSAIVLTNQLRESLDNKYLDTMPGGRGQEFFSHLILRTKRGGWIDDGDDRVGFYIRVEVQKSKVGTPWQDCELPFRFRGELDMIAMYVDRGIEAGIIRSSGPWYKVFEEPESFLGKQKVGELFRGRPDMLDRLRRSIGGG